MIDRPNELINATFNFQELKLMHLALAVLRVDAKSGLVCEDATKLLDKIDGIKAELIEIYG